MLGLLSIFLTASSSVSPHEDKNTAKSTHLNIL